MHQFLSSIGFTGYRKKELNALLLEVAEHPDNRIMYTREDGSEFWELSKEYGNFFGIALRGENDEQGEFQMEYYFPYFCGTTMTTTEQVDFECHADREAFAGVCDEVKIGVTLIFYLQNQIECFAQKSKIGSRTVPSLTYLSGLGINGMILFPVEKNEKQAEDRKQSSNNRSHLIQEARNGDEDAIESLTLEDIDTYSMLSRRVMHEDILTIVDTYFMPYGIESEQYSVLGEIMDIRYEKNQKTGDDLVVMTLKSNDLDFDVCINKKDLFGEPAIGRRFKGVVWMQGTVNYSEI